MTKTEKKEYRWQINRLALAVLFYNMTIFAVVIGDMLLRTVITTVAMSGFSERKQDLAMEQLEEKLMNSGWSSILGVVAGILLLILFFHKYHPQKAIFRAEKKMTGKDFLQLLCVFMAAQLIFSVIAVIMESFLNLIGFTMLGEIESASAGSLTISMFLYSAFGAPIGEEIVYRGFVLRYLQRYGRWFAIVVSAALFGAMHGNLVQGMFAFTIGLVLGYVTVEYSIKWAIFLHFLNNCVFGDLLTYLMELFPEWVGNVTGVIMNIGFFIVACILLIWKRKRIAGYLRENRTPGSFYVNAFTAVWMIVFFVLEIGIGISGIEPLS